MPNVMVTGGAGYIGSILVRKLLENGYRVTVVDYLDKGGESLVDLLGQPNFTFVKADIRDKNTMLKALQGIWAVCHLAAIVGDPACAKQPELAKSINYEGACTMYELAQQAGVERFIFSSTCSNYGKMKDPQCYVNEMSELAPVSLYAETKVAVEEYLLKQSRANLCKPCILRFATVYGLSPRIRFDLTVNEFTKELVMGRELVVYGEQFWRPYCHVEDLAGAICRVLETGENKTAFNVFNVGDTAENYTKKMIVDCLMKEIPDGKVKYVVKTEDPRDYRVDFSKISNQIGFGISKRVPDGISEIKYLLENGFILNPDEPKYLNI